MTFCFSFLHFIHPGCKPGLHGDGVLQLQYLIKQIVVTTNCKSKKYRNTTQSNKRQDNYMK